MIGVEASLSEPNDQAMSHCHGDDAAEPGSMPILMDADADCCSDICEGECPMKSGHGASANALLNSFHIPQLQAKSSAQTIIDFGFIASIPTSLYRPPILR